MVASKGVLTARGGMTSHAAVVARGMGKPCVVGCSALIISSSDKTLIVKGKTFSEGDSLTIDGGTGEILEGIVPTIKAEISNSGKPADMVEKISKSKLSKFLNDNSLLNQIWIMDSKKKVSDILKENSIDKPLQVIDFIRYKVGEGV